MKFNPGELIDLPGTVLAEGEKKLRRPHPGLPHDFPRQTIGRDGRLRKPVKFKRHKWAGRGEDNPRWVHKRWKALAWRKELAGRRRRYGSGASVFSQRLAIVAAMDPGKWYGRPDIGALTGIGRNSLKAKMVTLERMGLVERALNPEWRPRVYKKGLRLDQQVDAMRNGSPQWLWRLTEAGEGLRRSAVMLR